MARCHASRALEIDALGDRQPVEVAAQAIEPQFNRAEPDPLATAENARAARLDIVLGRDCDTDRAAEIYAVGPVVEIDQHSERMARAALPSRRIRHRLGGFTGDLA